MATIALGLLLMIVCACILHWSHRRSMLEAAALGMIGGLVLILFGMATR